MAEKNSLWKNIRNKAKQNRRTGDKPKEPTDEMLRQEAKIKAKKYAEGGPTGDDEDPFKSKLNQGQTVGKTSQDWLANWVQNPEFANRLNQNFPAPASDLEKKIYGNKEARERASAANLKTINKRIPDVISDIYDTNFLYNTNPESNTGLLNTYRSRLGDPKSIRDFDKNMSTNPQGFTDQDGRIVITNEANTQYGPQSVGVHELTHKVSEGDKTLDKLFRGKFQTPSPDKIDANYKKDEMYPFLMQMRFDNKFQPGEEITPERLKQIRESGPNNHLFRYYNDDEISKYLNTLASNQTQAPMQYAAQGGYYAEGGEDEPVTLYKKAYYNTNQDRIIPYAGSQDNEYYVTPDTPQGIDFERRLPELEITDDYNSTEDYYGHKKYIPSEKGFIPNPNYKPLASGRAEPTLGPVEAALFAPVAGAMASKVASKAIPAVASALELPAVVGGRTIPLLTGNNILGVTGGLSGANMLGSDISSGYYTSNASIEDKIARGLETGLLIGTSPGMLPAMGSAYKNVKNSLGKNKELLSNSASNQLPPPPPETFNIIDGYVPGSYVPDYASQFTPLETFNNSKFSLKNITYKGKPILKNKKIGHYDEPLKNDSSYETWKKTVLGENADSVISLQEFKDAHKQSIEYFKSIGAPLTTGKEHGLFIKNILADRIPNFTSLQFDDKGRRLIFDPDMYGSDIQPAELRQMEKFITGEGYDITKMTPKERMLMEAYAHGYDNSLNEVLRGSSQGPVSNFYLEQSKMLNEGILKNKFQNPSFVRRGVQSDYTVELLDPITHKPTGVTKLRSELTKGDTFIDKSFLSTSATPSQWGPKEFSELIEIPGGSLQSFAVPEAATATRFRGENEAILPTGLIRQVIDNNLHNHPEFFDWNSKFRTKILNPYEDGGSTNPYMYYSGGPMYYPEGGIDRRKRINRTLKNIGAGAYGVLEGTVDTAFGWIPGVDQVTDLGYQALQQAGNSSEEEIRKQNAIRGGGAIVGATGTAILTGGATTPYAIAEGAEGAGDIVSNTTNSKAGKTIGTGLETAGAVAGMIYGSTSSAKNATKAFKTTSKLGQSKIGSYIAGMPIKAPVSNTIQKPIQTTGENLSVVQDPFAAQQTIDLQPSNSFTAGTMESTIPNVPTYAPQFNPQKNKSTLLEKYINASEYIKPQFSSTTTPNLTSEQSDFNKLPEQQQAYTPQQFNQGTYYPINVPTFNNSNITPPDYNFGWEPNTAALGGFINNNSVNLQNTMRYKDYRKKYKQGGMYRIPEEAGTHDENAYGGVAFGGDQNFNSVNTQLPMAEGGEYIVPLADGNQYVISANKNGKLNDGGLSKKLHRELERKKSPLRSNERADIDFKHSREQLVNKYIQQNEMELAQSEMQNQQDLAMKEAALQYAAAGGKVNKNIERIVNDAYTDAVRVAEEDAMFAYGGLINPKDYGMPDSYAKGGIHIKESKKGTFTKAAKKRGKSVQEFARQVLANKDKYSAAMVKKANFAKNAAGWKHADGGLMDPPTAKRSYVQQGSNSMLGNNLNNTEFGSRIINEYGNGLPNDTSYIYQSPTEDYFYNTGQNTQNGKPVSNYNSGSVAPFSANVYQDRIKRLAGYANGGPVVSNVNQDFNLYAQNRGGMMMADGGMMPQDDNMSKQVAAALQQGADPKQLLQQLIKSGMDPQQAQAMLQAIMDKMQASQLETPMMAAYGGKILYSPGGPTSDFNHMKNMLLNKTYRNSYNLAKDYNTINPKNYPNVFTEGNGQVGGEDYAGLYPMTQDEATQYQGYDPTKVNQSANTNLPVGNEDIFGNDKLGKGLAIGQAAIPLIEAGYHLFNKPKHLTAPKITPATVSYAAAREGDERQSYVKYNKYVDAVRGMNQPGMRGQILEGLRNSQWDLAGRKNKSFEDEQNQNAVARAQAEALTKKYQYDTDISNYEIDQNRISNIFGSLNNAATMGMQGYNDIKQNEYNRMRALSTQSENVTPVNVNGRIYQATKGPDGYYFNGKKIAEFGV
jgi:hypothetical protein